MKLFRLPGTELTASSVVAGMMRIKDLTDAEIVELVGAAGAAGITMFDHADIYGGQNHFCESRFGQALKLTSSQREAIILQTKCGIVPRPGQPYYDFSHDHIIAQVEGSLKALQTDYIDILLLHRPDTLVEPAEVAQAFDELQAAGKVRYFGVSNHTPGQIELLRRYVRQPLVANQVQLSLTHSPLIAQGIAANMAADAQSVSRDLGLLDYARLHDITLQAWSPFQSGFFTGVFLGDPKYATLGALLDKLAATYHVTPMGLATAWIIRHPANIQVVTGTTKPARLAEAAAGSDVVLTRADWYELFKAADHTIP